MMKQDGIFHIIENPKNHLREFIQKDFYARNYGQDKGPSEEEAEITSAVLSIADYIDMRTTKMTPSSRETALVVLSDYANLRSLKMCELYSYDTRPSEWEENLIYDGEEVVFTHQNKRLPSLFRTPKGIYYDMFEFGIIPNIDNQNIQFKKMLSNDMGYETEVLSIGKRFCYGQQQKLSMGYICFPLVNELIKHGIYTPVKFPYVTEMSLKYELSEESNMYVMSSPDDPNIILRRVKESGTLIYKFHSPKVRDLLKEFPSFDM